MKENNFFGNNNKYIDFDEANLDVNNIDDIDLDNIDFDNIEGAENIEIPEVKEETTDNAIDISDVDNVKELIEENKKHEDTIIFNEDEEPKVDDKSEIVELIPDEELKPKTNDALYKMIVETLDDDKKLINKVSNPDEDDKRSMYDKSGADEILNNLTDNFSGASDYIGSIITKKHQLEELEQKLEEEKKAFYEERDNFNIFKQDEMKRLDTDRIELEKYKEKQEKYYTDRLNELEEEKKSELDKIQILTETLEEDTKNLEEDKKQFEKYKELEENKLEKAKKKQEKDKEKLSKNIKLHNERMKQEKDKMKEMMMLKQQEFDIIMQQLDKDSNDFKLYMDNEKAKLENETNMLADMQKEFEDKNEIREKEFEFSKSLFEIEKQKFERYRDMENKRLKFENDELSKGCARLKNLVSQFNSEFQNAQNKSE